MKIIIYGLGQNGKEFIQDIRELLKNVKIVAATDSYLLNREQKIENGIYYIDPQHIQDYIFDYIAVTPVKYYDEIKEQLCSWEIEEDKIKTVQDIKEKEGDTNIYCELCNGHPGVWKYIGMDYDIFRYKNVAGASKRRGDVPYVEAQTEKDMFFIS